MSTVNLKDVYDIVERLEDKMDRQLTDHEKRLKGIEGFINRSIGIISVAMLFASSVVSYITNKFIGKE